MEALAGPRAQFRPALLSLLCTVAVAIACSGKVTQAGGLEVQIAVENLQVGTDFDTLKVEVAQETSPGGSWASKPYYDGPVVQSTFPTTVAIAAGSNPDQNVRVTVTALLGSTLVVQSVAQTTVPRDQVLELDMYLSRSCVGVSCTSTDTSCVRGSCQGIYVSPSNLAPYGSSNQGGNSGSSGGGTSMDGGAGSSSGMGTSSGAGGDGSAPFCTPCPNGQCMAMSMTGGACACLSQGMTCPSGAICNFTGTCGGNSSTCGATCTGCCDPQGACVGVGGACPSGGTCTGPGGACGAVLNCPGGSAAYDACLQGGAAGCPTGCNCCGCCAPGQTCNGTTCSAAGGDGGTTVCGAGNCGGCCDPVQGCVPLGSACVSGGTCTGGGGTLCSTSPCAGGGVCATGCCAGGNCIPVGGTCPSGSLCQTPGSRCATQTCGGTNQPCCQGSACATGTCNGGICSGATSCSVPTEPVSATTNFMATLASMTMKAADGFAVLTQNGTGPMTAMLYFTDYSNACGYAQNGSAKSGGRYVTFGISPTSGSSYQSLIGTFPSGGMNLGAGIVTETPSGTSCTSSYAVGSCGTGSLLIRISQATGTQIVGSLSGSCTGSDAMSGNFVLPVCGTSLSVNGTPSCCP